MMLRGRDINNNPKEAIFASHQSGKGIKAIFKPIYNSNLTKIIHKWKTFEEMTSFNKSGHPSKFAPGSDHLVLRETAKRRLA